MVVIFFTFMYNYLQSCCEFFHVKQWQDFTGVNLFEQQPGYRSPPGIGRELTEKQAIITSKYR